MKKINSTGITGYIIPIILLIFIASSSTAQNWQLYWSDEFNGNTLDSDSWDYMYGDGSAYNNPGWGNGEWQYYTDKSDNVWVADGELHITAKVEDYNGFGFTSAKIRTKDKVDFTYGKIEASIRIPWSQQGLLPAFWMLPTQENFGVWPSSGEVDIMECFGYHMYTIHATLHTGAAWNNKRSDGGERSIGDMYNWAFHTFAVVWEPDRMDFYMDGGWYAEATRGAVEGAGFIWPGDEDFHIILNSAVNGGKVGSSAYDLVEPGGGINYDDYVREMKVDYVRVFQKNEHIVMDGPTEVLSTMSNVEYSIPAQDQKSGYSWSVPSGASIVSGQGTNKITVNFSGATSGNVSVNYTAFYEDINGTSGTSTTKSVAVVPIACELTFEDHESQRYIDHIDDTDGTLSTVGNPNASGANTSGTVGQYARNNGAYIDQLMYHFDLIENANEYKVGSKTFKLDTYTSTAPAGTWVDLYLVSWNDQEAGGTNGQHSLYRAYTSVQNQWETLEFSFVSSPDASVADTDIDRVYIRFAPSTWNNYTFYFDNFKSQCNQGLVVPDMTVSETSPTKNESITFTDASIGTITSYSWNFGDGASPQTATGIGPHSVSYSTPGHKSISLTLNGIESGVKTNFVYVHDNITACDVIYDDFDDTSVEWISGTGSDPTKFDIDESESMLTLTNVGHDEWDVIDYDFNNGSELIEINFGDANYHPLVQFRAKATDTATVSVSLVDTAGNAVSICPDWFVHQVDVTSEWAIYTIDFLNSMYKTNTSNCEWMGEVQDSAIVKIRFAINPGHSSFPYTNTYGDSVHQFTGIMYVDWIKFGDACDLMEQARLSASDVSPNMSSNVTITDESTGSINSWAWDFGDDAVPASATGQGPHIVAWGSSGPKTISLTVNGSITETYQNYIYVHGIEPSCTFFEDNDDGVHANSYAIEPGAFSGSETGSNFIITSTGAYDEWSGNFEYTINDGTNATPVDFGAGGGVDQVLKIRARATDTAYVGVSLVDGTANELNYTRPPEEYLDTRLKITPDFQVFELDFTGLLYHVSDGGEWTKLDTTDIASIQFAVNAGYATGPGAGWFTQPTTSFAGDLEIDWIEIGNNCLTVEDEEITSTYVEKLSSYPNPFSESTSVIFESEENTALLKIYNIEGKIISQKQIATNKHIQIGKDLPNGIYILETLTKTNTQRLKLIKTN